MRVQQRAEFVDERERDRVPIAEGLALPLQRLSQQRLGGGEVADGSERAWMPVAQGRALRLQRLAKQRFGDSVVALAPQQHAEVADAGESRSPYLRRSR